MTVARRLADVNAKAMTAAGGPRAGARIASIVFENAHGRTDGPARISTTPQVPHLGKLTVGAT